MTVLLPGLWLAVAVVGAWRWRPAPARARALVGVALSGSVVGSAEARRPPWGLRRSPVRSVGLVARRLLGRPADPVADRRLGWALASAVPVALAAPVLLPLVGVVWWVAPVVGRRREERRRDAALLAELPEVVDLFVLAIGAGLTVPLAVGAVARHQRGVIGTALAGATRRVGLGARLADALSVLPDELGERVRRLSSVLVASERYGVALLPALERLAVETRLERRRQAEATARRVPVKLLFPLVLCTLPAFALLTVVPLLAGSLRSLRL